VNSDDPPHCRLEIFGAAPNRALVAVIGHSGQNEALPASDANPAQTARTI